jgi:transposase
MVDGSSLLLDLDGVVVESVQRIEDRTRLVVVRTAPEWVGICPECGERSTRSKGWVATSPRNVQVGPDRPVLQWQKRKWLCPSVVCDRKVFTEAVPGGPARARVTPRAKASMTTEVLDKDRSVAAVALRLPLWLAHRARPRRRCRRYGPRGRTGAGDGAGHRRDPPR